MCGGFHRVPDSKIIHAYTNISYQTKVPHMLVVHTIEFGSQQE